MDDLTATGQSIWNNILDSETLKSGVDLINLLLTKLDNLTSSLGELGTLGVGIGGFTAIFNRDKSKQRFCPLWGRLHIASYKICQSLKGLSLFQ